jgi:hypothetical protein
MHDMNVLQQGTQMAPAHGKETSGNGQFLYPVSDARKALLLD